MPPSKLREIEERLNENLGAYLQREYVENHRSPESLARDLRIGRSTLSRFLDKYHIEKRTISDSRLPKGFISLSREELINLYEVEGMSKEAIARKYSVSPPTVDKWLDKGNIKKRTLRESKLTKGVVRPSKEELERLYLRELRSAQNIGEEVGTCGQTIISWLESEGIPTRDYSEAHLAPRNIVKPSREELRNLYEVEGMNTMKLAERYSVASGTISRWLNEHQIRVRDNEDLLLLRGIVKPSKEELESMKNIMTLSEISKKIGVNVKTIKSWMGRSVEEIERERIEGLLEKYVGGER